LLQNIHTVNWLCFKLTQTQLSLNFPIHKYLWLWKLGKHSKLAKSSTFIVAIMIRNDFNFMKVIICFDAYSLSHCYNYIRINGKHISQDNASW